MIRGIRNLFSRFLVSIVWFCMQVLSNFWGFWLNLWLSFPLSQTCLLSVWSLKLALDFINWHLEWGIKSYGLISCCPFECSGLPAVHWNFYSAYSINLFIFCLVSFSFSLTLRLCSGSLLRLFLRIYSDKLLLFLSFRFLWG